MGRIWSGNDFWMALKRFLTTIWYLRRGSSALTTLCMFWDGVLLASTRDVVNRWREYFKDLLNPTDEPPGEDAGPMDLRTCSCISGAKVAEVVKKTLWWQGSDGVLPRVP